MTAADIWNYSAPYIQDLGPAILVTAIIANTDSLIRVIHTALKTRRY